MLSVRYPTDQLSRHWNQQNRAGYCLLQGCSGMAQGSLEHIILDCPALLSTRLNLVKLSISVACEYPPVADIIHLVLNTLDQGYAMQFFLDCSILPTVVTLVQTNGLGVFHHLFTLSRNWCYSLHRKRMELLGLYQYR